MAESSSNTETGKMKCALCGQTGHRSNNKKFHPVDKAATVSCPKNEVSLPIDASARPLNILCPEGVIDGCLFTKDKRHELQGLVAGGAGSMKPEKYQRAQIECGTGLPCLTTHTRINWRKNEMIEKAHPMKNDDGFDYTENFDGKQIYGPNTVWYNLKSVVGQGGSQTRTLRDECYNFMDRQLAYLSKSNKTDYYFVNIFDGDEAAKKMPMFHYLLAQPEYSTVKKYVYVGDLKGCFPWIKAKLC